MRMIDADALKARARTDFGGVHDAVLLCKFTDEQPTIDPVRHGHIVQINKDDMFGGICSECNGDMKTRWRHCPSCGAKMLEAENGEK